MLNDPKWRVIAQKSNTRVCEVVSVALAILNSASQNDERGVYSLEAEDISAALDIDEAAVLKILEIMEGRFVSGGQVIQWEKRQPKREDNATERTKAWRERKRTQCDAPVTQCDAPEKIREDTEVLEDKSSNNPLPPKGVVLPDWLDQEIWKDFCQHRTKLKAPMTDRAKQMMIKELGELKAKGHDPTAVLSQSITRGWKGIFELKGNQNDHNATRGPAKPSITDTVHAINEQIMRGEFN